MLDRWHFGILDKTEWLCRFV